MEVGERREHRCSWLRRIGKTLQYGLLCLFVSLRSALVSVRNCCAFVFFGDTPEGLCKCSSNTKDSSFYEDFNRPPEIKVMAEGGPTTNSVAAGHTVATSPSGAAAQNSPVRQVQQVRVLQLNDGEHLNTTLFRLQKGWTLHFFLGPSLCARPVRIFVNHPPADRPFRRDEYYELKWQYYSQSRCDDSDRYAELQLKLAGSFQYFFSYDNSGNKKHGSGYFVVDPLLPLPGGDVLPLDSICIQTVLSKCIGPFSNWERCVRVSKETGYNMVHFTPIQALGESNSSYCISDQMRINPAFEEDGRTLTYDDVGEFVRRIHKDWGVLTVTDLVLNHTSWDSPWLVEHPECGYNLLNSPHLRPAYLLDRALAYFSAQVADGQWEGQGVPANITNDGHIRAMERILLEQVLPELKLWEFYCADVEDLVQQFKEACEARSLATTPTHGAKPSHGQGRAKVTATDTDNEVGNALPEAGGKKYQLTVVQDPAYRRLMSSVDLGRALTIFNVERTDAETEKERIQKCSEAFRKHLEKLNADVTRDLQHHLKAAVENCGKGVGYERLDGQGPKLGPVTREKPLVTEYFRLLNGQNDSWQADEKLMNKKDARHILAHNGWVMGDDPLRNFAEAGSNVYLRRELLAWGDNVKLRYGKRPEDCPFLWKHMLEYTMATARIFHGVRIDNCHSTPIHVAEFMLDAARQVNPDLYVVAELFTGKEDLDNVFVNRLGITSLVREAMSAFDSHEEGRLVYRYGGEPVGAFWKPATRPLTPAIAHAMFLDLTHDNPCAIQKRSVYDPLPSAALVAMASCAIGSTRGYDELVPHHIHVVEEARCYPVWDDDSKKDDVQSVNNRSGIIAAKRALNLLHQQLGMAGFNQVYVDQVDENIVAVTRHCPNSHHSVILVARTAFKHPHNPQATGYIPPLCIPGVVEEIILEARLVQKSPDEFNQDRTFINGLNNYQLEMQEHIQLYGSAMIELSGGGEGSNSPVQEVDFINFPPGSIIAFRVSLPQHTRQAVSTLRGCLREFGFHVRPGSPKGEQRWDFLSIVSELSLSDLNRVLYRCDPEERDEGWGGGVYHIPGWQSLKYCGLQGFISVMADIRNTNDLGHPFCENLRQGDWMPDYIANRLVRHRTTKKLGQWFEGVFDSLKEIPRYLIPCYFDAILAGAYATITEITWGQMSEFVTQGSTLVRALALCSAQFCGDVASSPLPHLSTKILKDIPTVVNEETGRREQRCSTLAAGLPHFSSGVMRCWGRDTFIALRGLLLVTGRYSDARNLILAFAGCLRHGLIPNLLGAGAHARFNCRDAVWWWLQCVQDYCTMVDDGLDILTLPVCRLFPTDESPPRDSGYTEEPLYKIIQEALQRHAQGISFRERHAGPSLDINMSSEGFNVNAGVDWETGFVFGGNEHNCGTWMDKMGESDMAGNKGKPATPRDGSAVEIVALCKSTLRWLVALHQSGAYPYDGVTFLTDGKETTVTFAEWDAKLQDNFEKKFWVASEPYEGEEKPGLIHRRGVYKDSVGASFPWTDYQLRPNFCIAMAVAPELFTPERAWKALEIVETVLLGPLGVKTLDPKDWKYRGNYINSVDSHEVETARGFNYHQGPEWLWPVGYFLRAKLHFSSLVGGADTFYKCIDKVKVTLSNHHQALLKSPWKGLPELTNADGAFCKDGCPTQAWSASTILDVLYDMDKLVRGNNQMSTV
ncbi:glycogen debranching enzyme-like isoform X2 [Branchiostoma floridae]|uniref:Glycogen debranching enzyme n=1 Tax=Branchiostoma floridae TaxID=7739 RepID=A0A9J7N9W2_BRAFL|nr:glycogen debranching enzyme-like isoform X2 [Branchiostoma floridae]